MRFLQIVFAALLVLCSASAWAQSPAEELARVLRDKKVITTAEYATITNAGPSDGVRQLTVILRNKGLITAEESTRLNGSSAALASSSLAKAPEPVSAPSTVSAPQTALTKTQNPTAPTDKSSGKLDFYGTLLFNSYFNDQSSNNVDIPGFATPKTSTPSDNFGATARQTRLGLIYSGVKAAGANLTAHLEMDFFGGEAGLANGINMDLFRLRLAYGRMEWGHFALEAGQDWNIFAPLNPTSYAQYAIPEFSAAGNLWIRSPQIRTEWKSDLGGGRTLLWQLAALDPDIGDNPAQYSIARQPKAGELGRLPSVETRLAFSAPIGDRKATGGVSAHWGTAKNTGAIGGIPATRSFKSWGAAADWDVPLSKFVSISGEAYAGHALGIFSGGIAQTVMPLGQLGDNGVGTRGGWLQVQLNLTKKWQSNTAYGIDAPEIGNLSTGSRAKNQNYMSNIVYHLSPGVLFALEWHRFLTNVHNEPMLNNINDQFNLAVAYTFSTGKAPE